LLSSSKPLSFGGPPEEPTAAEKDLAAEIKCDGFRKNSDGTWTSGPDAVKPFANNTFDAHGMYIEGANLAVVLDQKCKGH
jgi:hypothetical protein